MRCSDHSASEILKRGPSGGENVFFPLNGAALKTPANCALVFKNVRRLIRVFVQLQPNARVKRRQQPGPRVKAPALLAGERQGRGTKPPQRPPLPEPGIVY